jgi:hypothetical protein
LRENIKLVCLFQKSKRKKEKKIKQGTGPLFDLALLVQVSASKTKIYMVLEYVNGGELFDKIVRALPLDCKLVELVLQS